MKFLVLQKIRREVPVKEWAKLLPAQFKYLDELENGGKTEVSYHLIGQQGNLFIVDADSDGELTRIVGEDPCSSTAKGKSILQPRVNPTRTTCSSSWDSRK